MMLIRVERVIKRNKLNIKLNVKLIRVRGESNERNKPKKDREVKSVGPQFLISCNQ